jgi:hypothetical protein
MLGVTWVLWGLVGTIFVVGLGRGARTVARSVGERTTPRSSLARALDGLEPAGWLIRPEGGDSRIGADEFLVTGPPGVFVIHASERLTERELFHARARARELSRRYSTTATPVVCIARSRARPRQLVGVWRVGARRLSNWLAAQPRQVDVI